MKTSYDTNTGEWKSFFEDAFCASDTCKACSTTNNLQYSLDNYFEPPVLPAKQKKASAY
jgi:hypothetical protein